MSDETLEKIAKDSPAVAEKINQSTESKRGKGVRGSKSLSDETLESLAKESPVVAKKVPPKKVLPSSISSPPTKHKSRSTSTDAIDRPTPVKHKPMAGEKQTPVKHKPRNSLSSKNEWSSPIKATPVKHKPRNSANNEPSTPKATPMKHKPRNSAGVPTKSASLTGTPIKHKPRNIAGK